MASGRHPDLVTVSSAVNAPIGIARSSYEMTFSFWGVQVCRVCCLLFTIKWFRKT